VLIAPGKLTDFCPLYMAAGTEAAVSQFDKDDVEAVGLVKFDFLGLTTLTILDWTLRFIARLDPQARVDLAALPGTTVANNTVVNNSLLNNGTLGQPEPFGLGIRGIGGSLGAQTIDRNVITGSGEQGIVVQGASAGVLITRNSIFNNGPAGSGTALGIDLRWNNAPDPNDGALNAVQSNRGMATAVISAMVTLPMRVYQTIKVRMAIAITTGTNQAVIWSASF